ncbi:MAG: hypothetical protein QF786_13340, partial [Vicinamibacterales bacterium]|nr:hypothetical protein [Vicinamibacterales bacterium]
MKRSVMVLHPSMDGTITTASTHLAIPGVIRSLVGGARERSDRHPLRVARSTRLPPLWLPLLVRVPTEAVRVFSPLAATFPVE